MSHFFTKPGFRGFTLIELLVVIAIIGLLSTVIAAPITEARKKGRDSKKISDLRSVYTAINIFADDNAGDYPASLAALVPRYLTNIPANAGASTIARDKYMYVTYTDSLNSKIVGYHLGVKLEAGNQSLSDDADCGGVTTPVGSSAKSCIGAASSAVPYTTAGTINISNTNWAASGAGATAAANATSDFGGGSDSATSTCTQALDTCIYDITN
jgi:prepilin-type N-terminal cleavage/methylation domain-containing protein